MNSLIRVMDLKMKFQLLFLNFLVFLPVTLNAATSKVNVSDVFSDLNQFIEEFNSKFPSQFFSSLIKPEKSPIPKTKEKALEDLPYLTEFARRLAGQHTIQELIEIEKTVKSYLGEFKNPKLESIIRNITILDSLPNRIRKELWQEINASHPFFHGFSHVTNSNLYLDLKKESWDNKGKLLEALVYKENFGFVETKTNLGQYRNSIPILYDFFFMSVNELKLMRDLALASALVKHNYEFFKFRKEKTKH